MCNWKMKKSFQSQHGLKADGIAGNQTLVRLNLYLSQQGPRLTDNGAQLMSILLDAVTRNKTTATIAFTRCSDDAKGELPAAT